MTPLSQYKVMLQMQRHIQAGLAALPDMVVIDPAPLTPDSFAAYFRRALKIKRINPMLDTPEIVQELWDKSHQDLTLSLTKVPGKVAIGSADAVRGEIKPVGSIIGTSKGQVDEVHLVQYSTVAQLEALCIVKSLPTNPPVKFAVADVPPDLRFDLESRYDVVFDSDAVNPTTFRLL